MTGSYLLDNSAWVRLAGTKLAPARRSEVAGAIESGQVVICLPFLLEAGYSARNGQAHRDLLAELSALPWAAIDEAVERRAIDAQGQLARAGHHRLPPVDLIIAALAHQHGLGVLHYDRDYDLLLEKTNLQFPSEWLAPPGAL